MKYCSKCGKELVDEAVICPGCGCQVGNGSSVTAANDAPSTGFAVLGFLIPLVGFIIWLTTKNETPLKAKSAGKGALIGFIVGIVFSIIYGVIVGTMVGSYYY